MSIRFAVSLAALCILMSHCQGKEDAGPVRQETRPARETVEPVHLVLPEDEREKPRPAYGIEEKEPNDYTNWAMLLPPDTTVGGFIHEPRVRVVQLGPDRDFYRFEVPGPERKILWVKLTGVPNINLMLEIRDAKNQKIHMEDAAPAGKDETIVNLTIAPGVYYFVVGERWLNTTFLSDLKNPYTLTYRLSTPTPGQEMEPNNDRRTAGELTAGQAVSGYLHAAGDADFYRLDFGSRVLRIDFRGISEMPVWLAFWNEQDKNPVRRFSVSAGGELTLRQVSPASLGARYVSVMGQDGHFSLQNQYALKVTFETASGRHEVEPNDQLPAATPLSGMSGQMTGTISRPQDKDFFSMNFARDMSVSLRLSAPPELPHLRFCLMPVKRCVTDWAPSMEIHHQVVSKGSHWVEIEDPKAFHPDAAYTLSWTFEVASDADEREPNNRPEQAGILRPGVQARGYLIPRDDVDFYVFQLEGSLANPPVILVELSGGESIDPGLVLLDSFGNIVMEDTRGVYGGMRKVQTAIHPGQRYFVRIREKSGNAQNPQTPYLLRLTHLNPPRKIQY